MNSKTFTALLVMGTTAFVAALVAVNAVKEAWSLQDKLKEKEAVITKMAEDYAVREDLLNGMMQSVTRLSTDLYQTKEELNTMKGRSDTVLKKPELVEKLIDKSFSEFGKEMECVTGMQSACP